MEKKDIPDTNIHRTRWYRKSRSHCGSNCVSGVGFLGAGVIFKDGLTITGITTATTIWISAALGMAVRAGQYFISVVGGGVVLVVLILFENFKMCLNASGKRARIESQFRRIFPVNR